MKKICFITTLEGTLESFIMPSLYLFKNNGYDITVISDMTEKFIEKYGNTYHCINVKMKKGLHLSEMISKPFEFYRIFKREKFDYVQYATTNASLYTCVPAWVSHIPHRVCCLWGIGFYTRKGLGKFLYKQIEKFPCRFATHISIPSKKNQLLGAEAGLYNLMQSSVVGDGGTIGVDLSRFDYSKRESFQEEVLNEYPQLKDKVVFGYVGRMYKDKGSNELLEAFLKMHNNDCALLLIGPFDEARTPIDQGLLARARKCKNIIFHGATKDVPKYLSALDVLVHPSYHEGFSMAIQEAMAMGCAIITTNVPGPSEVIEDGKSGITVPIKNSEKLAEAMILMKDKEIRDFYRNNGLVRVRQHFNRERMIQLTFENRVKIIENII